MSVPRTNLQPSLGDLYDYLDSVVGAYSEATVLSGAAVALTTNTTANVTSLTLTPGDYNIFGMVGFLPAASTSITALSGGNSVVSATIDVSANATMAFNQAAVVPGAVGQQFGIPVFRISLLVTTTIYLVARATFTVSTMGAYGTLSARKMSKP